MAESQIKVTDNGPLQVSGQIELLDAEGNRFATKETFYLCRCGLSSNKPFCDGSHKKGNFINSARATKA